LIWAEGVASVRTCAHVGAGISCCEDRLQSSMQLCGFDFEVIKFGPSIKWFIIDREGFRHWEAGEMARGNAGNSVVVVDHNV